MNADFYRNVYDALLCANSLADIIDEPRPSDNLITVNYDFAAQRIRRMQSYLADMVRRLEPEC